MPYIRSRRLDFKVKKDDERRLETAELWCYRRMLPISGMEKRMLGAICGSVRSMDRAAQSMDPYLAQESMDRQESVDRAARTRILRMIQYSWLRHIWTDW